LTDLNVSAWGRRQVLAGLASGGAAAMLSSCGGDENAKSEKVRVVPASVNAAVPEVTLSTGSPPPTFRLYSFANGDPGTVEGDGAFIVREGYDGIAFPIVRTATLTGKPIDHSFRDPSVVRDPVSGTYWMTASGHFIYDGPQRANCDFYRSEANDGINFKHVCTIPADVPGAVGMWAPDLLPYDGQSAMEFVVTLMMETQAGARVGVPYLYRAISPDHSTWACVGPLTGPAIPASTIDWTMVRVNGAWIGCAVDFTKRPKEFMFLAKAPDRLGPWTSLYPAPLFNEEQIEGPQFFIANGKVGLYYDRFTGSGLQYRETTDFRVFSPATQVQVPVVPSNGTSTLAPPRHGTVLYLA
jgi:hypothetical protein